MALDDPFAEFDGVDQTDDPFAEFDSLVSDIPVPPQEKDDPFAEFPEAGLSIEPAPATFPTDITAPEPFAGPDITGPIPSGAPKAGQIFAPEDLAYQYEQERGLPGIAGAARELPRGIASGLLRGGEMAADTVEWFSLEGSTFEGVGAKLSENIKKFRESRPGTFGESKLSQKARDRSAWNPRGWWFGGGESFGMMAPGLAAGVAAGPIVGAATTGGLFWGGTAQESYDEINKKRPELPEIDKIIHANLKGFAEGGLEAVQQFIPFGIAKAIPKRLKSQIIKKAVGGKVAVDLAKDYLKMIASESAMEMFQEWTGGAIDYQYNLREDLPDLKEVSRVIGPTIIATSLLGTGATLGSASQRSGIQAALADPSASPEMRQQAVDSIHQAILAENVEGSEELANAWMNTTAAPLRDGAPIIIQDDDYYRENGIAPPKEVLLDSMLLAENENEAREILETATPEDRAWLDEHLNPQDLTEYLEPIEEMGGPSGNIQAMIEGVVGFKPEQVEPSPDDVLGKFSNDDIISARKALEGQTEIEATNEIARLDSELERRQVKPAAEAAEVFKAAPPTPTEVKVERREAAEEAFTGPEFEERQAKELFEKEQVAQKEVEVKEAERIEAQVAEEAKAAEVATEQEKLIQLDEVDIKEQETVIPVADRKRMKKEALVEANADPVYRDMAAARTAALDIKQIKTQYTKDSLKDIPGYQAMFTLNGRTSPDGFAQEHGYKSLDAMIEAFKAAPPKKTAIDRAYKAKVQEWGVAEKEMQEAEALDKPLTTETIDSKKSVAHGEEVNTTPTEAMKEAGNYKKFHFKTDGLDISIENPIGTTRTWVDDTGKTGEQTFKSDYGYIKGTEGFDKDHVDIFVKPGYKGGAETVYVINQTKKDSSFDEHKSVIGVGSEKEAMALYNSNYEKGWDRSKSIVAMPMDEFKEWVKSDEPKKGEVTGIAEVKKAEKKPPLFAKAAKPKEIVDDYFGGLDSVSQEAVGSLYKMLKGRAGVEAATLLQGELARKQESIDRRREVLEAREVIPEVGDVVEATLESMKRTPEILSEYRKGQRRVRLEKRRAGEEKLVHEDKVNNFLQDHKDASRLEISYDGPSGADQAMFTFQAGLMAGQTFSADISEDGSVDKKNFDIKYLQKLELFRDEVLFYNDKLEVIPKMEKKLLLLYGKEKLVEEIDKELEARYGERYGRGKEEIAEEVQPTRERERRPDYADDRERARDTARDEGDIRSVEEIEAEIEPKFAKGRPTTPKSTVSELTAAVDKLLTAEGRENLSIEVVQTVDELVSKKIPGIDETVKSVYHRGKIYLVSDNLSLEEVWNFVLHEGGHKVKTEQGWSGLFGKRSDGIMKSIDAKLRLNNPAWKAAEQKAIDAKTPSENIKEETITYFLSDSANQKQSLYRRIVNAIRAWAVNMGITRTITDADIVALAEASIQREARKREAVVPTPARELAPAFAVSPLWHSRLRRLVNDFQVEKQPASAWASTFNSWKKKGKLPPALQEELEWSGLEEVLAMRGKEKITKGEILDLLAAGGVQVEETMLGAKDIGPLTVVVTDDPFVFDVIDGDGKIYKSGLSESSADQLVESAYDTGGDTKFAEYQLPGGENYREMLIALPESDLSEKPPPILELPEGYDVIVDDNQPWDQKFGIIPPGQAHGMPWAGRHKNAQDASDAALEKINREALERWNRTRPVFKSTHFDQPNILAHVRMNERTDAEGNRVLFIEEIQSDWHQAGRKRGYGEKDKFTPHVYSPEEFVVSETENQWVTTDNNGVRRVVGKGTVSGEEDARLYFARWLTQLEKEYAQEQGIQLSQKVPDAPFKKSWSLLAMKRMISYAADNGFDKIAWTTGEQQAERYDLSKQVDSIGWYANPDDTYNISYRKDGETKTARNNVPENELDEIVGKDLAVKIIKSAQDEVEGKFAGLDLKVGGEGMKGFYDKILPSTVGKFIKKYGGKVGETDIDVTDQGFRGMRREYTWPDMSVADVQKVSDVAGSGGPGIFISPITGEKQDFVVNRVSNATPLRSVLKKMKEGASFQDAIAEHASPNMAELFGASIEEIRDIKTSTVHSFDITPQMKEAVATEGMPLFAKGQQGEFEKQGTEIIDRIIATMKERGQFKKEKIVPVIKRYEDKISKLKQIAIDSTTDITAKQKQVRDVLQTVPMHVRGRAINEIVKVGEFKTPKGRGKAVDRAMGRIVSLLDQYYISEGIKDFDKKLKKARIKIKKGIPQGKSDPETLEQIRRIRTIREMTFDQIGTRLDEIIPDDSVAEPTDEQASEMALLNTFGNLRNKTSEEVADAIDQLDYVITEGRLRWNVLIEAGKARRRELADMATEVIRGTKKQLETHEKDPVENIFKRGLREFSDKSQNWQWLLDKLSRFDKESDPLKSRLSKHFVSLVHGATHRQNAGISQQEKIIRAKLGEIYDVTGGKLARRLKKNAIDQKKTGINLYDEGGTVIAKDIKLSQNKAYKKWQEWHNPQLRADLIRQGVTEETMSQIEKFMIPEVKAWAKWQMDEFYVDYYDSINEVFRTLTYTNMPKSENYVPIRRDYARGKEEDLSIDGSASYHASMWKGSHKQRVKNNLNIAYMDGDTTLSQHIAEMEHFKAWALSVRDMRSVFGNPKVRKAIKDHHGPTAMAVIDDFIETYVRGGIEARDRIGWLDGLRSAFTKMVLAGNVVVYIKQLTSFPAYAMDIPVKDFMVGFVKATTNPVKAARILMQSDMMQARYDKSQMERDVAFAARRTPSKKFAGTKNISDTAMIMTKMGDKAAIIMGGYAVYDYHIRQGKTHEEALEEFEIATENAQQASGPKDLSFYQRGGSIQKGLTMFMTSLASYARHWEGGLRNLAAGRGSVTENLKRVAITHIILPTLFQLAASGGEWDEQKMKRAWFLGPLTGLFIARDLLAGIADTIFLGRAWGMSQAPHLEAIYDIVTNIAKKGFDIKEITSLIAITRVAGGIKAAVTGETEHPIRRALGYSESALNVVETSYKKHNSDYNKKLRRWKNDRTKPRPNLRLMSIKKQITAAKKSGDKKLEMKLKQRFVDTAKKQ